MAPVRSIPKMKAQALSIEYNAIRMLSVRQTSKHRQECKASVITLMRARTEGLERTGGTRRNQLITLVRL